MTVRSKSRGNNTIFQNDEWVYESTQLSVAGTHKEMPCGHCGRQYTEEGHDACLGTLIGVMNACCGHGKESEAYVQFWDGECIRGKDALVIMEVLKRQIKSCLKK